MYCIAFHSSTVTDKKTSKLKKKSCFTSKQKGGRACLLVRQLYQKQRALAFENENLGFKSET